MPLNDFLYRCVHCGSPRIDGVGRDVVTCSDCGTRVQRKHGAGGELHVDNPYASEDVAPYWASAAALADALDHHGGPRFRDLSAGEVEEARAQLSRTSGAGNPLRFRGALLGFVERFPEEQEGWLRLTESTLRWVPDPGATRPPDEGTEISLLDIRSLQTSSRALQWSNPQGEVMLVRFPSDSARRWDDRLKAAIQTAWWGAGRGDIAEFQPRIRPQGSPGHRSRGDHASGGAPALPIRRPPPTRASPGREFPEAIYRGARALARILLHRVADITVEGVQNVPSAGPFLLLPNHQAALDPLLVQAHTPRIVRSMTKSTQFGSRVMGWLLPRLGAFPVRRYQVDGRAVASVLRLLDEGMGVCIYPEGERTWDGRIGPFRTGTLRVALRALDAGIPVIPVGISGMFELWPRWGRLERRMRPVALRFGEPLELRTLVATQRDAGPDASQAESAASEPNADVDPNADARTERTPVVELESALRRALETLSAPIS
jgi:1-acyl-sn-glycerol-3-phosphate acyltransferase